MSDEQKFEKEEKGDDNMEPNQMQEKLKRKIDEKQMEMEKETDSMAEDKPKIESEEEPNTSQRKRKKKNFPSTPPSKRRTRPKHITSIMEQRH